MEQVKYNNDFNLLPMPKLTGKEMDIFMLVISKMQNQNREIEMDGFEFFKALHDGNTSYEKLFQHFKDFADKILTFKIHYDTKEKYYSFICFERVVFDYSTSKVKIKAQEDFYQMLVNYKSGFTLFELIEFADLKGTYTKTLYRLLKQYRQTGYLKMDWDRFCQILDIPNSYQMSDIDKQILKPALKELLKERIFFDKKRIPFKNLEYTKIKDTKGKSHKVIGIEFKFQKQEVQKELELEQKERESKKILKQQTQNNFIPTQEKKEYTYQELNELYRGTILDLKNGQELKIDYFSNGGHDEESYWCFYGKINGTLEIKRSPEFKTQKAMLDYIEKYKVSFI